VQIPFDQAQRLATLVLEKLQSGIEYPIDYLKLLAVLPDEATHQMQGEVLQITKKICSSEELVWEIFPMLLRWRAPGTAELLGKWARKKGDQSQWVKLTLGVFNNDPTLIDQAAVDGLPKYSEDMFIALAGEHRTPGFIAACRALMTGKAEASFLCRVGQLRAAEVVAEAEGIAAVWPTLLALIESQRLPLDDALSTALSLLGRHQSQPDYRTLLINTLQEAINHGPREGYLDGKEYYGVVRAIGAIMDLGEPMPQTAVNYSLALLQALTKNVNINNVYIRAEFSAVSEVCRILAKIIPELDAAQRKQTLAALKKLQESPFRIGRGELDCLADDISYTTQLQNLISQVSK
jgi:hypothetical protein